MSRRIYVDKYKFNNKIGEFFAYRNFSKETEQAVALDYIMYSKCTTYSNRSTVYTNWFYFKDPYPNQKLFIEAPDLFKKVE